MGDSFGLEGGLAAKSKQYFMNYHKKENLEVLHLMFEGESWQKLEGVRLEEVRELSVKGRSEASLCAEYANKVKSFLHSPNQNANPFRTAAEIGSFKFENDQESSGLNDVIICVRHMINTFTGR